jgi:hypothetical protein
VAPLPPRPGHRLLRCPICNLGLAARGGALVCGNGHSFDVAREGYVNLLPGVRLLPAAGGDGFAQLQRPSAFLDAGHFDFITAEIAQRLQHTEVGSAGGGRQVLDAGRAAEAYAVIEAAEPNPAKDEIALADLRIAALTALSRNDEAQALRWTEFTRGLRKQPLRDLLKRLPDFSDVAREEEALAFAAAYPDPHRALDFLTAWPDLRRAAAVVEEHLAAIDGNAYWSLAPAAERLEAKEPLAAILLYHKMIDFTLDCARSSR